MMRAKLSSDPGEKIPVVLEFDDPAFKQFFSEVARLMGLSLGEVATLCMQTCVELYLDEDRGMFERWGRDLFKGKEELLGSWLDAETIKL